VFEIPILELVRYYKKRFIKKNSFTVHINTQLQQRWVDKHNNFINNSDSPQQFWW